MKSVFRGGIAVAVTAAALLALGVAGASAATLSTTGSGSPYPTTSPNNAAQIRSTTNITFAFFSSTGTARGTITCAHPYGIIANGNITNSTIGSSFATNGSIASGKLFFGTNLGTGATASTACPTTISGITNCTAQNTTTSYPIQTSQDASNTGITAKIGALIITADCTASGGGSILGCQYTTGNGSPAPITSDLSTYSGSPLKASTFKFTDQPFYKTGGPAGCPPATSGAGLGKFNGTFALYGGAGSTFAGQQISAYK